MKSTSKVRRVGLATLVAGGVAALALACGGDTPMEGGNGGGGVASVSVSPAEDSIAVGETAQFTASAEDANGSSVSVSFSWSSTNTSVATVDGQGVATGEGDGMAEIVASASGVADSAELTVAGSSDAEPVFQVGDNYFEDPQGRRNTNASVELTLGDTVRWDWVGSNQHNVTSGEGQGGNSGDGVPSNGSAVSSPTQSSGDYEFVPDVTGTWEFYCSIHPNQMYGSTFTVTSSSSSSVSADRLGAADLEPGDVIRPEDSHIVFIYRGREGGE